jgi:hypothetical protein
MTETTLMLVTPAEYRAAREVVFPTAESLRWFMRQHRADLVARGAIVAPTGRKLVSPGAFDSVVLEVGARRAGR